MSEHYNLGDMIKGDKIYLQAGFIPRPNEIKIGQHHSYKTYGVTNATAWIDKSFRFVKTEPVNK